MLEGWCSIFAVIWFVGRMRGNSRDLDQLAVLGKVLGVRSKGDAGLR